jgi:hypothetical protein
VIQGQTHRQTDSGTDRQTDRGTDRQTDRLIDRQTDTATDIMTIIKRSIFCRNETNIISIIFAFFYIIQTTSDESGLIIVWMMHNGMWYVRVYVLLCTMFISI